jgi:hypothetical protein
MKFTKNTIMLDIAKRMGDNELKLYKYRSWSAFQNTLATLAADRTAWERQEISPLLKTVPINMEFEDAAFAFSLPADAIAFTDVWIDPKVENAWGGIIKRIDEADAQRASTGEIAFMPAGNEIFWYNIGDEFRFILSRDMYKKPNAETGTDPVSGSLSLEYVADPSTLDFELAVTDLSPYTGFDAGEDSILPDLVDYFGFSSRFLYRCINDSVIMLVADNQVARPEEKAIDIEDTSGMGAV